MTTKEQLINDIKDNMNLYGSSIIFESPFHLHDDIIEEIDNTCTVIGDKSDYELFDLTEDELYLLSVEVENFIEDEKKTFEKSRNYNY